jgi:hypothetical protein
MTLSIKNPRARSRWTLLSIVVGLGLILGMMIPMIALAAPPKISLEQCRNGSANSPNNCASLGGSSGWVNGNAGEANAHFVEGHSIPYRALITDGPLGNNVVTLGYDIKHSGTNAIDFLTHFDRLNPHGQFGHGAAETIDPRSGTSGVGAAVATCAIPKPSNLSAAAGATFDQIKTVENRNNFTVYGADSCSVTQGAALEGDLASTASEARVVVTFNATSANVVLAWGGHIARSADWNGNGAAQISGSPYHMRVKVWSAGNVGNQDRSLSAAAVLQEQSTITTTIHLNGDEPHTVVPINTSVPLGSSVHDLATVTGFGPTGDVTFTFYRGGDCTTGTAESAGTVALTPVNATTSVAHPSSSKLALAAGDYAFKAVYAGDGTNVGSASACEPFSVSKANLNVTTTIHRDGDHVTNYDRNATNNGTASVAVDSTVHDVALVGGAVTGVGPTGAITFTRWSNGTCAGDGTPLAANGADGTGTKSADVGPLSPGDYSFKATIAADDNYATATSPCEALKVDKASPTLATAPWVYPNDKATISGLVNPQTGSTLTFTAYTDANCTGTVLYTQTFNDILNQEYNTSNTGTKVSTNSTVRWTVAYSGDVNNVARTSACAETIGLTFTSDTIPAP